MKKGSIFISVITTDKARKCAFLLCVLRVFVREKIIISHTGTKAGN
jgi:hypothetical protein